MDINCSQLIKNSMLLRIVIIGMVVSFFSGCLEYNMHNVMRTPQGTYGCERGYNKITCPECSGTGQLEVMPWETMNRKKKGSLSGLFSREKNVRSGYKKCWRCGGDGVVCKKDDSYTSTKSKMSLSEENLRNKVHMAASHGGFTLIDKHDSTVGDIFYISTRPGIKVDPLGASASPANIPLYYIEYSLKVFGGIKEEYEFFKRFAEGSQKGLAKNGCVEIECIYYGTPMSISLQYIPSEKNLAIFVTQLEPISLTEYNAVYLRDVDVSIKK